MKKLTKLQAYNAMLIFLDRYYGDNKSDNLSDFITYAYFWFDGKPADPAAWPEWQDALKLTAQQNKGFRNQNRLTRPQVLLVITNFFKHYCSLYTEVPSDMVVVLKILDNLQKNKNNSSMWQAWVKAMDEVIIKKDPRFYIEAASKSNKSDI